MKIHGLVYNNMIVGFRFYFPKLGYSYDITKRQFDLYFEDINKNMFNKYMRNCGNMYLVEVGEVLLTEDEQHFKYKVISLENNDSPASWLSTLIHLDIHIDRGSDYIYKPVGRHEFDKCSMCTVEDLDLQNGKVVVKYKDNSYLVGIRDLTRVVK